MKQRIFIFGSATTLMIAMVLVACTRDVEPIVPDVQQIFGPYTATGTLTSTGASLYRRGTHLLSIDGEDVFFLESREVDLNMYNDQYVVVEGELTPNTHPRFLPVLQVDAITPLSAPAALRYEQYALSSAGLTLEAPADWIAGEEVHQLTFQMEDEELPFIRIEQLSHSPLPEGLYILLDGRNGVRTVEDGIHRVFTALDDTRVLLLTYAPKGPSSARLRDAFYTMINSVDLPDTGEASSSSSSADDGTVFIPCGGPAGVVCPEGMYCEVRELDTGIGACKTVGE